MRIRSWLLAIVAIALGAAPLQAAPARTEYVEAELHSARRTIAPGEAFDVALRLKIIPDWHTYWRNPGDSGAETTVKWKLPAGAVAGPIGWPTPEALPYGPLVNYGYSGETLYPIRIQAPANAPVGQPLTFSADIEWLVCKDICIPETVSLALSVPVAAQGRDDADWAKPIAAAVAALPVKAAVDARITAGAAGEARLSVAGGPLAAAANLAEPYFFPFDGTAIDHAKPQAPQVGPQGVTLTLSPGTGGDLGAAPLAGVLVWKEGATRKAIEIEATPGPVLTGAGGAAHRGESASDPAAGAGESGLTLPLALAFAFLGGLILNVMPCVLPVLSIKALGLARGAQAGTARRHGVAFTAGVMATFLALAGALIGLQAAGQTIGWGFQLQEPVLVAALALLFFAIGLNLLGAFEIGGSAQNFGAGLAEKGGDAGAFFTGALAVVAATPCTAPFMGAALGFTLTQPPVLTLLVFAALALGFAAPMAALSFAPGLAKALPKPGPWMDRFKQFLAFPMFATAIWLVWVLAAQGGANAVAAVAGLALTLAFAVWAMQALSPAALRWGLIAPLAALALVLAGRTLLEARDAAAAGPAPKSALASAAWSVEAVAAARAEGRPVFVNFTAAWCVTCKVNEVTTFADPAVRDAFASAKVAAFTADWTRRDGVIAAELAAHGRTGVPLYLLYPAGTNAAPVVLPQQPSAKDIIQAVAAAAPQH